MFGIVLWTAVLVLLLSCIAEYVDSTLGMGYGTSLTPILLLMGFKPLQIVPAILLAELFTGLFAGIMHNAVGNANFSVKTLKPSNVINGFKEYGIIGAFKKGVSLHLKIALIIGVFSVIGSVAGATAAIKLPDFYLKLYIGVLITVMGIYILITYNKKFKFTWNKLTSIAILASFNKGISGGGYGPVVTGGQILSGVEGKNAVAITSLAEAITCMAGLAVYIATGQSVDWSLAPLLIIGGIISVFFSAFSVKKLRIDNMKVIIGVSTIILGVFTLSKLVF